MKLIFGGLLLVALTNAYQRAQNRVYRPQYNAVASKSDRYDSNSQSRKQSSDQKYDSSRKESTKYSSESNKKYDSKSEHESQSTDHCGKNEIPVTNSPGLCECDYTRGFARLDGINCLKCPQHGFWEATAHYGRGECQCEWDYKMVHGKCVLKDASTSKYESNHY